MESLNEKSEYKRYLRSDIINILRDIETIIVSLDRVGSCKIEFDTNEYNQLLNDFVSNWDVFKKLSNVRRVLSDQFSDELGDDDMEELEREFQDLAYWSLSKRNP